MVVDYNFTTVGLEVSFDNLSEGVPVGYLYRWDFGDNSNSEEENPIHVYGKSKFYKVILSVLNNDLQVVGQCTQKVAVSNVVKTTLSDTIYKLIDTYIPTNIFGYIPINVKKQFIEKWQLYIQPLVNHKIPIEEYNNELYYEALENQLIMELAAYDYMVVGISNMLKATYNIVLSNNSSQDNISDVEDGDSNGNIKAIKTGPTEVEYFNASEMDSEYTSNLIKAMQPGGVVDLIRQNLCMLADRLDILLPICNNPMSKVVVPRVVNRRDSNGLKGPDPFVVVNK